MKKLLISISAASLIAAQSYAGGLDEPIVEAVEVVEDEKSALGWVIPLVALGLVALAISQSDDDERVEECDPRVEWCPDLIVTPVPG